MLKNRKTIALTILTFITITLIGAYITRGWIRESFLPYGPPSYFARKSLEKAYEDALASASQPVSDLGLNLESRVSANCSLFAAEGFQTRVDCYASSGSELTLKTDYIRLFKQNSLGIEKRILESGWTKVHNAAQPIDELFNNPDNDVSIGVNYKKNYGKNSCTLTLMYNAFEKTPSKLHYYLNCYRVLNFLGDPEA